MTDPNDTAAALAALREAVEYGDDRRTPLYRWMLRNHDAFASMLEGNVPNWSRISEAFAGLGFTEQDGQPLKKNTVRLTWWRAKEQHRKNHKPQAKRAVPGKSSKTETVGLAPDIIREVVAPSVDRKPRVSPITPVSPVSPAGPVDYAKSGGSKSVEPQEESPADPDETMRVLNEQMNQRRQPMPKPINASAIVRVKY